MLFRKWESWFVYGCSVAALLGSAMTPVSASITYFDPADITINNQSDVRLDLDGDGFDDLSFSHSTSFITLVLEDASSTVRGVNGSGVVGSGGDAALLSAGTLVGPGSTVSGGADNTFAAFNDNLLNLFGSGSNDGQWWGGGAAPDTAVTRDRCSEQAGPPDGDRWVNARASDGEAAARWAEG